MVQAQHPIDQQHVDPIRLETLNDFSASGASFDLGFAEDLADMGSFDQLYGADTWDIDDSILNTLGTNPSSSAEAWNIGNLGKETNQ